MKKGDLLKKILFAGLTVLFISLFFVHASTKNEESTNVTLIKERREETKEVEQKMTGREILFDRLDGEYLDHIKRNQLNTFSDDDTQEYVGLAYSDPLGFGPEKVSGILVGFFDEDNQFEVFWETTSQALDGSPSIVDFVDVTGDGVKEVLSYWGHGFRLASQSLWVFGDIQSDPKMLVPFQNEEGEVYFVDDLEKMTREDIDNSLFLGWTNANLAYEITDLNGNGISEIIVRNITLFDDGSIVSNPLAANKSEIIETVFEWDGENFVLIETKEETHEF